MPVYADLNTYVYHEHADALHSSNLSPSLISGGAQGENVQMENYYFPEDYAAYDYTHSAEWIPETRRDLVSNGESFSGPFHRAHAPLHGLQTA